MTQVAEPGAARATASTPGRISHWIGGRFVAGTSGREGAVYNPATGTLTMHVDFASVEEVAAAVAAAKAAFPAWRATSLSKRTDIMFKIRNLVEAHRKELAAHLTAEHGKVPPMRSARSPAVREPRVRDGNPEPAQGRLLRAGLDRHRRLSDPPAARRRRRHHAVQLPGDGPDVDVRHGDRVRQHVHPQALGEGSVRGQPGRAARRSRRPGRRLQRRPRRQGRGRCDPRAPRHRGRVVRRLDADRALHLRDGHEGRQARRRSAAPRTT